MLNRDNNFCLGDITIATCSNKSEMLVKYIEQNITIAKQVDAKFVVIFDESPSEADQAFLDHLHSIGARIYTNGSNRGLSYSRNIALQECDTKYLLFLDDDVTYSFDALYSIRQALESFDIVGTRILGPPEEKKLPIYMTEGQLHYLAIHNPLEVINRPWGACFAFNNRLARRNNITFRIELGRKGDGLQSGDDTTFISDLQNQGALVCVLNDIAVIHHIDQNRWSLAYLLRRVFWQGRSERRRANVRPALVKEWRRYSNTQAPFFQKWSLAVLYFAVLISGIVYEVSKDVRRR